MTTATPTNPAAPLNLTPEAIRDEALAVRREHRGLIGIRPKLPVRDTKTLSLVYTPGVARPCLEIAKDALKSYDMTIRGNTVAVISDGSSVYGLGNVGAAASIPLLEVRSAFHKSFAGIDAMPIALDTQNLDEIVEIVRTLTPTFGGIQLDAISSPRCFAIDERLKRALNVPVLHTDQEAVAVGILAALQNALKVVGKTVANAKIVISGAGAAGVCTAKFLLRHKVGDIKVCDRHGVIGYRRLHGMNWVKSEIGRLTNAENVQGTLADVVKGADVFIGLSATDFITPEMIGTMAAQPIVFALSLSAGEMTYAAAKAAGAAVVATSQSGSPNQLNASVIYPGIFRGALDVRATGISHAMYDAAASAYAAVVDTAHLSPDFIMPDPLDPKPAAVIAQAVAQAAMVDGVARETNLLPHTIYERVMAYHAGGSSVWVRPPKPGIENESNDEQALDLHTRFQGTMEMMLHVPIDSKERYDLIYSAPHSSEPCRAIAEDPSLVYDLTLKNNLVGIVTDGSAVLGLGNIGPTAGLPVMQGKAVLFKSLAGVEGFPICLRTQDPDEIIAVVKAIAPVFGGINLEDIAAPQCFDIEQKLTEALDIPVFHDDQHGTAVVVLAGMLNAVKIVGKTLGNLRLVVNGAGASALSVVRLLMKAGVADVIICDRNGAIYEGREDGMNRYKADMATLTNLSKKQGTLAEVLTGADAFLGLSGPRMLTGAMIKTMQPNPIVFALANPTPEIMPEEALAAGVGVLATGRSDFPNQVNNSLAFPGIFRGALDVRARTVSDDMKIAAARAIANLVTESELSNTYIIPGALDVRVPPAVARAVAHTAIQTGVSRLTVDPQKIANDLAALLEQNRIEGEGSIDD